MNDYRFINIDQEPTDEQLEQLITKSPLMPKSVTTERTRLISHI